MAEYKIFKLDGVSALGSHSMKVRARTEVQAKGMADAAVSDRTPGLYVAVWVVTELPTNCPDHDGCDGAEDTHRTFGK